MFAALTIGTAVALLAGVRHEPAVRAWALHPRTPARIAHRATTAVRAAGIAVVSAVATAAGATLLVVAFIGAVDQAAGAL